jgi:alanine racemase
MATVSTLDEARAFSKEAARQRVPARLQVKVDTGMGRLGVFPKEAAALVASVAALAGVELAGVFTHLAASEDDRAFTRVQRQRFEGVLRELRARGIQPPCVHVANSGGLLHEPGGCLDLVRPGLLVYGVVPPGRRRLSARLREPFRPALSLKSRVSLVREVPRGTTVSYGHTFTAPRRMRLATVAAGYGDGFPRSGAGQAAVLVEGVRCPVVGRVTMDQVLVDATRAPGARAGSEAVLIGRQ